MQTNVKVGLFVTIGAMLFIAAVYFIGSRQNLFGSTFTLHSVFGNVNGLQPGNNVRFSGINVGTVESITILSDSTVQVNMQLQQKVQPYIRKDALASIGSDGLVGSMLVNISSGKGKRPPVEDGDFIPSYRRVEAEDILNTLGKTNENIALISSNLLRITERLNKGSGTLAMLLRDSLLAEQLRGSLYNLRQTSYFLRSTGEQLDEMTTSIRQGEGLLGQLFTDTTTLDNLNASIDRIDTLLIEEAAPIFTDLQASAAEIAETSASLRQLIGRLDQGEGPLGVLLQDTAAAAELQQTIRNLEEGSRRFNLNMEALHHNFLFRPFFKKLEKEKERAQRRAEKAGN